MASMSSRAHMLSIKKEENYKGNWRVRDIVRLKRIALGLIEKNKTTTQNMVLCSNALGRTKCNYTISGYGRRWYLVT